VYFADRGLLLLSCAHKQQCRVRIGGRDRGRPKARVRFSLILRLVGLVQLVRAVMVRGSMGIFVWTRTRLSVPASLAHVEVHAPKSSLRFHEP
jgi:hypothetical protein